MNKSIKLLGLRSIPLMLFQFFFIEIGFAQLVLYAGTINYSIDFDNTVAGINNGVLNTITPIYTPAAGRMDAAGCSFTGSSFIGQSNGSVSTAGWYSFLVNPGNRALGCQPTSAFDYHDVSLKMVNNTQHTITSLTITFKLYAGDTQGRNSTINYTGSSGSGNSGSMTTDNILSTGTATISTWKYLTAAMTITGLSIPYGGIYTLKWATDRGSGSGNSDEWALDDVQVTATTAACTAVTSPISNASNIQFTELDCDRLTVNWSAGTGTNSLVVISTNPIALPPSDGTFYRVNARYGLGDVISAGTYSVYNGTGTSVTVIGLTPGALYYVAVYSFNGLGTCVKYYSGALLTANQITNVSCKVCPIVTGIVIDACNGACDEGDNEIVYLKSGSFPLPVNSTDFIFNYNQANLAPLNYTSSLTTNAATLAVLNSGTASMCPAGTFIDALSAGTIPPNTNIMLVRSTFCPASYNLSNICAEAPIYVLFSNSAFWSAVGNFGNVGCGATFPSGTDRYFQVDFTGLCQKCLITYQYSCSSLNGNDGAFITPINPATGINVLYSNTASTSCNLPMMLLPIQLTLFEGQNIGDYNEVYWRTEEEINLEKFIVERSADDLSFYPIGEVLPKGISTGSEYTFVDEHPLKGMNYYRLRTRDTNGESELFYSIGLLSDLADEHEFIAYQDDENIFIVPDKLASTSGLVMTISLTDMTGKEIRSTQELNASAIVFSKSGLSSSVYLLRLSYGSVMSYKKMWIE